MRRRKRVRKLYKTEDYALIHQAYNSEIKKFLPYNRYLEILRENSNEIRNFIKSSRKKTKNSRGGFLSLIVSGLSALIASIASSAPVVASAVSAVAPIVAEAAISTGVGLIIDEIKE